MDIVCLQWLYGACTALVVVSLFYFIHIHGGVPMVDGNLYSLGGGHTVGILDMHGGGSGILMVVWR